MKRFLLWFLITAGLFAGLGVPYHLFLAAHPRSICAAVDTSFEMQADRAEVRRALEAIGGARYARFSLVTDKVTVQGWQGTLDASRELSFYGPRDLSALADAKRNPVLAEADRVVVLTNARDTSVLRGLPGLSVITLP